MNGGTCTPVTQDYNMLIPFPSLTKTGYSFGGWRSTPGFSTQFTATIMPAESKTLYAKWNTNNKYTVTFDENGGDALPSEQLTSMEMTYDSPYGDLPSVTRT